MKLEVVLLAGSLLFSGCAHKPVSQAPLAPAASNDVAIRTGYAPVNGAQLYFEVYGAARTDKKPLVLIHGGGSTIESNFKDMIPLFSRDRQVIAIEEEGHGHTADVGRPFTFNQTADDVAGLLRFLKVESADILGFSNGGTTAMRLAVRHPETVGHLIIASAMYRRDGMMKGFWEGMAKANIDSMPEELKAADRKINPDPKHQQALFERDSRRMKTFKDFPDKDLTMIKAPTLILGGDQDVVTIEHFQKMAGLIRGARIAVLPSQHGTYLEAAREGASWTTSPELTAALVTSFLEHKN